MGAESRDEDYQHIGEILPVNSELERGGEDLGALDIYSLDFL